MTPSWVVVPCYNEARRLDVDALLAFGSERPSLRFLLVDDGSTDDTWALLQRAAVDPAAQALRLPTNQGKGEAVRRGMLAALDAGAGLVGFWDADASTPLVELDRLIDILTDRPEVQIAMGSRVKLLGREVERRPVRHYAGRGVATLVSLLLGLPVYDTQCGAKLFRGGPALRGVLDAPFLTRWLFDVELLARWLLAHPDDFDGAVVEVPLRAWRDVPDSKLRPRDFVRVPSDLWRIRRAYFR